jgi:hypothetical protein
MVNDQVKVIGARIAGLMSIGVYFTEPMPLESAAKLPGKHVQTATADAPLMIGEFDDGSTMVVNLSLERSTKVELTPVHPSDVRAISPVDGSEHSLDKNSIWLPAGQGVLMRFSPALSTQPTEPKKEPVE